MVDRSTVWGFRVASWRDLILVASSRHYLEMKLIRYSNEGAEAPQTSLLMMTYCKILWTFWQSKKPEICPCQTLSWAWRASKLLASLHLTWLTQSHDIEARHGSTLNGGLCEICKPVISLRFRVGILNRLQRRGRSKRYGKWISP
jgi:hypothetical protein